MRVLQLEVKLLINFQSVCNQSLKYLLDITWTLSFFYKENSLTRFEMTWTRDNYDLDIGQILLGYDSEITST